MRDTSEIVARAVWCALVLGALSCAASAQALPEELTSKRYSPLNAAITFVPIKSPTSELYTSVWFDASTDEESQNTVTIAYVAQSGSAEPTARFEEHSVSFVPLTVISEGMSADAFFVVGWEMQRGHIVIETWSISQPVSIGVTTDPMTLEEQTTLSIPRATKRTLGCAEIGPVQSGCYYPHAGTRGRLFLLTYATPTAVYAFDLQLGEVYPTSRTGPIPIATSSTIPGLNRMRSIGSFDSPEVGFLVTLSDVKDGGDDWMTNSKVLYVQDADRDGTLDGQPTMLTTREFYASFPSSMFRVPELESNDS